VAHRRLGGRVPEVGPHGPPGQRLERQRRDELARAGGHHDLHVGAALAQPADELGRLVGGDAAGDAEQDQPAALRASVNLPAIPARIRHWPASERPREKLIARGPAALSDAELLAVLFGTGMRGVGAVDFARGLLGQHRSLRALLCADRDSCLAAPGLPTRCFAACFWTTGIG
jgi:hypothetical protein